MRHATPDDLVPIEALLKDLRSVSGLVERSPGTFYRRSRAFLHFHADPSGLFADIRLHGEDFERLPVDSPAAQAALLGQVRIAMGENVTPG
jgi:N-acetylglutamate synthase-like GNAT family acetyltransferase